MRRTRLIVIAAAIILAATPSFAHERCGCRDGALVLNGRLNTADFDGGVGDRFGSDTGGGGTVIAYSGASSGAFAAARASAFASVSSHAFAHSGGHGGGHAGGYGGGHH